MGDYYTEQLVKRSTPGWTVLIKALLILATAISVVLTVMLPFVVIAPVIMVCVDILLFRRMDVEYEYLYVNGNLDIDKIMAKAKRKRIFEMQIENLEVIAPAGSSELRQYQRIKADNYGSRTPEAKSYEMIVLRNGEKRKIIFEPNQTILDGMRMMAPRKVFLSPS